MPPALSRAAGATLGLLMCTAPFTTLQAIAAPSIAPQTVSSHTAQASSSAARPHLTAKASVKSTKAWQQFHVRGSSTRLPAGTRVTLQQLQHKRWVSLPIHMNTTRKHTYDLRVKLGIKGPNKIRIVGGGATSNLLSVTIR